MVREYKEKRRKIGIKKYLPVFSVGTAVVFLIVLFFILRADPDISGEYETRINGKITGTILTVKEEGDVFSLEMSGEKGISSGCKVKKNFLNNYVFEIISGPHTVARYEVKKTPRGLEGIAYIIPFGKVDIGFVKMKKKEGEK